MKSTYSKSLTTLLVVFVALAFSCNRVKEKTKQTINKGGETVGKTATEFFEGVSEGVGKTMECKIALSENLIRNGIKTGKFYIDSDTLIGSKNKLTLYLIFEKDFSGNIKAKSYDKNGRELGRTDVNVNEKAGNASYFDFIFDRRTNIEQKSNIILE
jgi:hypothetical protein